MRLTDAKTIRDFLVAISDQDTVNPLPTKMTLYLTGGQFVSDASLIGGVAGVGEEVIYVTPGDRTAQVMTVRLAEIIAISTAQPEPETLP